MAGMCPQGSLFHLYLLRNLEINNPSSGGNDDLLSKLQFAKNGFVCRALDHDLIKLNFVCYSD